MINVLLVEDDDPIARPLAAALSGDGYNVTRVATGNDALVALSDDVGAVVLDLGLPDIDGVEVCRRAREQLPLVPILILTARTSEADVVVGLDAGADDYVTKPFRLAELLARLRALLRRAAARPTPSEQVLTVQDVKVDRAARRAWCGDEELDLSPKEYDLLALLVEHAGSVVTREKVMRDVWDTTWMGSTKTVDMHVSWLRRKLHDEPHDSRYITTIRGVGFRFETETPAPGDPDAGEEER